MSDPNDMMLEPEYISLGENILVFTRLGYQVRLAGEQLLEAGLMLRVPLGHSFREYPGVPWRATGPSISSSDFGGEQLNRIAWFYLSQFQQ